MLQHSPQGELVQGLQAQERELPANLGEGLCGVDWITRLSAPEQCETSEGQIRVADLFSGCGGLTLGAWEAARHAKRKFKIQIAVDNWLPALEVYRENFDVNETVAKVADIADLLPGDLGTSSLPAEAELIETVGTVDVLMAGPPCQGHSDLNNQSRRKDERNELYLRVVRFAELAQPRVILIENVPPVVHAEEDVVNVAKEHLSGLGYGLSEFRVQLGAVGLPQARRRHILVAVLDGKYTPPEGLLQPSAKPVPVSDYLRGLEDEPDMHDTVFYRATRMSAANLRRVDYLFDNDLYDLPNDQRPVCHQDDHSYKSMYGRMRWDEPAQTITSGFGSMGQGRYVHPIRRRVITPHEAARLQGFPDFFDFSSVKHVTHLREIIANAVPPKLAAFLILDMIEQEVL